MLVSRYLIREVSISLCMALFVLTAILISQQLIRLLGDVSSGEQSISLVLKLLLLHLPYVLMYALPLAFFLGSMTAYGRLYADSEMLAFFSSGLSRRRFYTTHMALACCIAALVAVMSIWATPYGRRLKNDIMNSGNAYASIFQNLAPSQMISLPDKKGVAYIQRIHSGVAKDIFIALNSHHAKSKSLGDAPEILVAKQGELRKTSWQGARPSRYYLLQDGYLFHGDGEKNAMLYFHQYGIRLFDESDQNTLATKSKNIKALLKLRHDDSWAMGELQSRISQPLTVIVLAILAIPMARTSSKSSRFLRAFPAILIYMTYLNLLNVALYWVNVKKAATLFWPHLLVLCLLALWGLSVFIQKLLVKRRQREGIEP